MSPESIVAKSQKYHNGIIIWRQLIYPLKHTIEIKGSHLMAQAIFNNVIYSFIPQVIYTINI